MCLAYDQCVCVCVCVCVHTKLFIVCVFVGFKLSGHCAESLSEMEKKMMHWPGVEPGSIAWKATMLTVTPPTLI